MKQCGESQAKVTEGPPPHVGGCILADGRSLLSKLLITLAAAWLLSPAEAAQWEESLAHMTLKANPQVLAATNCVPLLLESFQPDATVKALVFMPGATDEFYMFHRAHARLTNTSPTLLDAVVALTNQTFIHATFEEPLLLLHTDEDPLDPLIKIENADAVDFLKRQNFGEHQIFNDRDWNHMQPAIENTLKIHVLPWRQTFESWHFYRHSFAAGNLNGLEAIKAITMAGKTKVTISKRPFFHLRRFQARFEPDGRVRTVPTIEPFKSR